MLSLTNRLALNQITETIEKEKQPARMEVDSQRERERERERERGECVSPVSMRGRLVGGFYCPPRLPFELV